MPVPDYQTLMRPLLAFAQDGTEKNIGKAIEALSQEFALTAEEKEQLIPSGKQTVIGNRVHWARTYLKQAEALRNTRRSHFVITERGQELLQEHPARVDNSVLEQFPEVLAFKGRRNDPIEGKQSSPELRVEVGSNTSTPDDAMQDAASLITEKLRSDLLDRIFLLSPAFFEQLVVDLVVAMGYGGNRGAVAQRLGKSGDGGIDGVVNQDPLGLDVVYLQAKKYAADNVVGRPAIQQFAGALIGRGASKGVFITTSSFSSGAEEYAKLVPQKIILINGHKLADLMIQHDVGVRVEQTFSIKRVDLDYFEENED